MGIQRLAIGMLALIVRHVKVYRDLIEHIATIVDEAQHYRVIPSRGAVSKPLGAEAEGLSVLRQDAIVYGVTVTRDTGIVRALLTIAGQG